MVLCFKLFISHTVGLYDSQSKSNDFFTKYDGSEEGAEGVGFVATVIKK